MHAPARTHTHPHTHTYTKTHTHTEVFALLSFTLQNVNYFLAGTVADGETDRHAEWSTAPSAQASASTRKRDVQRVVDYTKLLKIHESGLLK
jgi:hypothetical protein